MQGNAAGFDLPGGDAVGAGPGGERGHVGARAGGHEGDFPGEHVVLPAVVGGLGHGVAGSGPDPVMAGVPADRGAVAGAQLEGGGGFGGVAEPVQDGQLGSAGLGCDQAQRAAGLDGRELPVIAEQPHPVRRGWRRA